MTSELAAEITQADSLAATSGTDLDIAWVRELMDLIPFDGAISVTIQMLPE